MYGKASLTLTSDELSELKTAVILEMGRTKEFIESIGDGDGCLAKRLKLLEGTLEKLRRARRRSVRCGVTP